MCSVMSFTNSRKFSFLATKSVSQFTSTSTPTLPCKWMYEATIPSFVARVAFFAALAMPLVRKIVSAFSRSPPLSTRARLQSMNPALVFSRSCLTSLGSISVVAFIVLRIVKRERVEPPTQLASGRYACHFHLFANAGFAAGGNDGIDQFLQNHSNRADRVVVACNGIIDKIRISVGVHDVNHRDPETSCLIDGVLLSEGVDHHERIGQF